LIIGRTIERQEKGWPPSKSLLLAASKKGVWPGSTLWFRGYPVHRKAIEMVVEIVAEDLWVFTKNRRRDISPPEEKHEGARRDFKG